MPTIKNKVRDFLRRTSDVFSPHEISDSLGLNANTVRRVMTELRNEGTTIQPDRGQYLYQPENLYIYKFKGYKDGTRWNMTFTSDHELSSKEQLQAAIEQSDDFGNIELVAEGEAPFEEDMEGWDNEDTEEDT